MAIDRIKIIDAKWLGVINNINKELARLSVILDDADIKNEIQERWESLGNHSLQYLYQREKSTMDQAVLQLMNKVDSYESYIKEMRDTFEELILMQEQEVVSIKRKSGRGRPRTVTIKEPNYQRKEVFKAVEATVDKPKGPDPMLKSTPPKKKSGAKTKMNPFEIEAVVKQAYHNTPVGHRTLSQIHLRAPEVSKGTVFNYIKKIGYVLDGVSVHEKYKSKKEKKEVEK